MLNLSSILIEFIRRKNNIIPLNLRVNEVPFINNRHSFMNNLLTIFMNVVFSYG
jgi:hypothetical protein